MDMNETLEQCAIRELKEETGVHVLSLDLVGIYDAVNRDPRDRIISTAFMKVIRSKQRAFAGDDAANAEWFDCEDLPPLAFDHKRIINDALKKLKRGK